MRNFLIGLFMGLVLATFAPGLAESARSGFDSGRELAGSAIESTGHTARP
ncbi:hypothetical protein LCGC14_0817380 [marine sediment metagenome]|uniref:Uncharacterized protein n=1 Tax=marine sediment metagenome TaxID=412755 RepID=A0A0F9SSA4_9ZZZZ